MATAARSKAFDPSEVKASDLATYVGDSIQRRKYLAEDLAQHLPDVIVGLVELARGVRMHVVQETHSGEEREHIYTRAPNARAIKLFLDYAGYDIAELGNGLLALSKVAEVQANVKAKLSDAKAKNLQSQTKMNIASADVFTASLIEEERMNDAVKAIFAAGLAYLQTYPLDMMREVVATEAGYQEWKSRYAREANKALALALGMEYEDAPQLPPGDELEES